MNANVRRAWMVEHDLAERGISFATQQAFLRVPREEFVPKQLYEAAYEDDPLPIGEGQTISQPYIVALSIDALGLEGGERVLEIGTGSGYAAAILGVLVNEVYSVERLPTLAARARATLARLGHANVHVLTGDGTLGWPEHAPYDAILVSAAAPRVPRALLAQLAVGGRLVVPVGEDDDAQVLVRVTRTSDTEYRQEPLTGVRFVPLVGEQGFSDDVPAQNAERAPSLE